MTVSVRLSNEDEYDMKAYEEAIREYRIDPKTYSLDEMEIELGLR